MPAFLEMEYWKYWLIYNQTLELLFSQVLLASSGKSRHARIAVENGKNVCWKIGFLGTIRVSSLNKNYGEIRNYSANLECLANRIEIDDRWKFLKNC